MIRPLFGQLGARPFEENGEWKLQHRCMQLEGLQSLCDNRQAVAQWASSRSAKEPPSCITAGGAALFLAVRRRGPRALGGMERRSGGSRLLPGTPGLLQYSLPASKFRGIIHLQSRR